MPPPVSGSPPTERPIDLRWPEEEAPADDLRTIFLVGDEQIHQPPDYQGVFSSLLGNSIAPARRLPASIVGVTHALEALLRGAVSEEQRKVIQGMITTGDVADVANTEELETFFKTLDRIKKADPVFRNLLFMIGNHEVVHYGVSRSGWDFFGLLGLILKKGGVESYKKDIQVPAVGGGDKILDKKVTIEMLYRYFFDKEPDPTPVAFSNYREYRTKEGKKTLWGDTDQVFRDFWKQEKDESWNAPVHYLPGKKNKPETQYFLSSAVKMGDFETSDGPIPVWFLSMDTMDYLVDGSQLGALQGHVSYLQVRVLQAFMDRVRTVEPNAKFVLGGHFPVKGGSFAGLSVKGIADIQGSGLRRLLSDEDVVAYIGAHTHDRGYDDLNGYDGIDRGTPLPQIIVPAVMDYPNEMVRMRYGVESSDPSRFVLQFDFTGIDPETLPGNSEAVCRELKRNRPYFLTYDDGIAHIKDDQIREFASPGTPLLKRFDIAANLDGGVLTRFERAHDEIIQKDVIPAMVEDTQAYLRHFMSIMKLSLIDAGWEGEAERIEAVFLKNLDHLDENYERIWRGEYTEAAVDHSHVHTLDRYMEELDDVLRDFRVKALEELEKDGLDPVKKDHLARVVHVLPLIRGFLGDYRHWLVGYEGKLRTKRGSRDFIYDASLGGSFYFKSVLSHLREIPYGSSPWAFINQAFLEAGEQRVEFYGGEKALEKAVPDRIRLEISPSGARRLAAEPLTETDRKVKRRGWCEPDAPQYAIDARKRTQALVVPTGYRGLEWHWSYRLGPVWQGTRLTWTEETSPLAGELGGQVHILNQWDKPRLNAAFHVGGTADFDGYWDVYGRAYLGVGDPWGLIEAGPTLKGGLVLSSPVEPGHPIDSFVGAGVSASLFEGLASFEVSRLWYDEGENDWRYFFNIDLATGLRALHWTGVADWVSREF